MTLDYSSSHVEEGEAGRQQHKKDSVSDAGFEDEEGAHELENARE